MPTPTPDDAALNRPGRLGRELVGLIKAVAEAEAAREARLQEKLGDLDRRIAEVQRVRTLIAGGAARREARLRAIEDTVEAMAEERSRAITPRPLDLPKRNRFDASVVDMHSAEPDRSRD